jgi:endonuclease/exonuclease/phosphatase family metal-dependent hydrolase
MRGMRTSVFTLLALVAGCVGGTEQSTTTAPVASDTTLRVTHWNIQVNGEGTDGRTDINRTYATLRAKAADADIITCNECYASTITSFATRLTNDTGVQWYHANFDVGSHNHSGIWSRYPLASTPVVKQYSQPASMSTGPKTAGEVDLDVNGHVVHLIVTRLCSPCGGSVRAVQAQELVAWAEGFGEPRLIDGDFNDNPGASSTSTMAADYIDVYRQAKADGHTTTYPDNTTGRTHGCSILDYLWLSKDAAEVGVVNATVPDLRATPLSNPNPAVTEKIGCSDDYGVRPSDHNMVKATFTLGGAAAPSELPAGWSEVDVGDVGKAGSTSTSGGAFTITAGGTSVYSTEDAFHFVYQPWTGDGTIIARVDAIAANGGSDAGAGVMFRESVNDAGSRLATMLVFASGKAKFRSRSAPDATIASVGPSSGSGAPRWVKLTRTGNHFEGFTSTDGSSWGSPIATADVAMPSTLWVGLAGFREGNFSGAAGQVTLSNVSFGSPGVASPWRTGDVGAIDVAGTTASSSGTYTIDAGGTWIWSTSDSFRFVYQPWRGDGTLIAHVDSLALGGGTDAAAGVQLRGGVGASDPLAAMLVFSSGKAKFRTRSTSGASVVSVGPSSGTGAPRWVKLVRTGNHFAGYVSTDGASWGTPVGSADLALPDDVWAGLTVVREGNPGSTRARGVLSSVSLHE